MSHLIEVPVAAPPAIGGTLPERGSVIAAPRFAVIALLIQALALPILAQEGALSVMSDWKVHPDRWVERQDGSYMLSRRLNERAFDLLRRREAEVAGIHTAAGWESRRDRVRQVVRETLGPWPEKGPLNARTTGVIHREGFRVEKVAFESQPGFHVTAALYVPDGGDAVRPGILYIPGHNLAAFRAATYQNQCLNLVHKGFVVLAYDPIGQGERYQEVDPLTGKQLVDPHDLPFYKFHSYPGSQCFLSGVSIARYFVWDAIRGIDYLVSRPEVDPERIGVTGHSGGGNLTVYTGAVEDRIKVAVPSCWVTSQRRMLEINGVQDAENSVYHDLKNGIEHADWLLARAPKPTMLLTTSHDHYPIQGARETAAILRRVYGLMGAPENFVHMEDDHDHGYTRRNSEASYAFLMKHLGVSGDASERSYPLFTAEELQVTSSGQVVTEFKAETVFSLNRRETAGLLKQLADGRKRDDHLQRVLGQARALSGYRAPKLPWDAVYRGGFRRDGYRLEKWALSGGPNAVIPFLFALPDSGGPFPVVVYLHPGGKTAGSAPGGAIEGIVRKGYAVAAPDVIGTGETQPAIGRQNDHNAPFYLGALIGSSVAGVQAEDVTAVVSWLQSDARVQPDRAGVLAAGAMGPAAIHAAAFNPEIRWLLLDGAVASYASVVMNQVYRIPSAAFVPGALTAYDLPDLLASLAPRKVLLMGPVDEAESPLDAVAAGETFRYPASQFQARGAGSRFRIVARGEAELGELLKWCGE